MFDDFLDLFGEFMAFGNYCQVFRIEPKLNTAVKCGALFDKVAFMVMSTAKKVLFFKIFKFRNY